MEPVDIVMVTHNRLDYLERTIEALLERTPEPIRLTLVDNASEPEVRAWIAERRDLFEHVSCCRETSTSRPSSTGSS